MTGLIIFIFGLILGSFLNVVIYRTEQGKSFVFGRSYCPKCKKTLAWYDNLPLLSFIVLRGRCRRCRKPISWQYPAVELATALIFLAVYWRFGWSVDFAAVAVFSAFLLLIFIYDAKHYLILDIFVLPALLIAFLFNFGRGLGLVNLLVASALGAGFFGLQYAISRGKWIGDGDIRLGALMGAMLGWQQLLVALFAAYLLGAVFGLGALASRRKQLKSAIPFGPFLALGTFIALLFGRQLLNWYLGYLL